jgi:predicted ATPase
MKEIFVITGAPGGGKSSIIAELEKQGFSCLPEESRILIKELLAANSPALPWLDLSEFNRLLLERQIEQYNSAPDGHCFFDRSFVDNLGYLLHSNAAVPDKVFDAIGKYRFNKTVFFTEAWEEIYSTDEERKEPFSVAVTLASFMRKAYLDSGYEVVTLPKGTVQERVKFILDRLNLKGK